MTDYCTNYKNCTAYEHEKCSSEFRQSCSRLSEFFVKTDEVRIIKANELELGLDACDFETIKRVMRQ